MVLPVKRYWQFFVLIVFAIGATIVLLNFSYMDLQKETAQRETLNQAKLIQAIVKAKRMELEKSPADSLRKKLSTLLQNVASTTPFRSIAFYVPNDNGLQFVGSEKFVINIDSLLRAAHANGTQSPRLLTPKHGPWVVLWPVNAFGYLLLFQTPPVFHWFSKDFWMYFSPLIIFMILLFLLILIVIYHSFKTPLSSVRHLAEHLQAGDYQYRIQYPKQDEFTDIFSRINRSLEKLGSDDTSYRQKETKVRTLLEALDESIIVLNKDLKLHSFNPAAVRLLHCESEDNFVACFARILEENMALRNLLNQFRTLEQKTVSRKLVLWAKDNQELHINLTLQRLGNDQFLLTFKDLSRIKELQNNLLRSMKFGIIANLVSSISHEIRNPLSAVGIHTEILSTRLQKAYPELDPKLKKSLRIIQDEIKRINRIHTQFFNLARKRELTLSTLKPNALIEDVVQLVQHHALEQQIHLETDLDANIDFIYGDADQLKQVILNVVLNAFQAVGEEGRVVMKTHQDGSKIYLEISDNGPGIPPQIGEHIFDLYFTTKADGGGIGLALCKKIVEAHEGRIWFRSSVGQGTTFIIALPRLAQTHKERIQTRLSRLNQKSDLSSNIGSNKIS